MPPIRVFLDLVSGSEDLRRRLVCSAVRYASNCSITGLVSSLDTMPSDIIVNLQRLKADLSPPSNEETYQAHLRRVVKNYSKDRWLVFLNCNAYFTGDYWSSTLLSEVSARSTQVYCGQPWVAAYRKEEIDWIRGRSWFSGKPFLKVKDLSNNIETRPGGVFAHRSYFWLRQDFAEKIGWPEYRLPEFVRSDLVLSEAVRQSGNLPRWAYYDVVIDEHVQKIPTSQQFLDFLKAKSETVEDSDNPESEE